MHSLQVITLGLALGVFTPAAPAQPGPFPKGCEARVAKIRNWQPAPRHADLHAAFSDSEQPAAAVGDFDGNGQDDLVVLGTQDEGRPVIAVCLSMGSKLHVHLLRGQRGCNDVVRRMAAGSLVVPLLSSRPRVLATDAFVTSCLTSPERKAFVYDREGQYFSDVRY